jgi:hypothetical protein
MMQLKGLTKAPQTKIDFEIEENQLIRMINDRQPLLFVDINLG